MKKKDRDKKILNKHFFGMVAVFILVIITILTFISFLEEIIEKSKIV